MQALFYYISLTFIYFFSYLPLWVLYKISDFLFYINYNFIKYRRKVVHTNLINSFPNSPNSYILDIEKNFFGILTDYMVEVVKSFTISKKEILTKGTIIENPEMTALAKAGKNIIISVGHVGNQELVCLYLSALEKFPFTLKAAYHQLGNPYFEKLFYNSRVRFGAEMYPMRDSYAAIAQQNLNSPFAFFLVNDQSAPPKRSYWSHFLNQETGFYKGMAVFAKNYDMPVFFMHVKRPKRGHFELSFQKITDKPTEITEAEILEQHVKYLEKNILEDPQIWLWSHKRWKHKRPVN